MRNEIPINATGTIEKFMSDFNETKEQAIQRWQALARLPLPGIIRPLIKEGKNEYFNRNDDWS